MDTNSFLIFCTSVFFFYSLYTSQRFTLSICVLFRFNFGSLFLTLPKTAAPAIQYAINVCFCFVSFFLVRSLSLSLSFILHSFSSHYLFDLLYFFVFSIVFFFSSLSHSVARGICFWQHTFCFLYFEYNYIQFPLVFFECVCVYYIHLISSLLTPPLQSSPFIYSGYALFYFSFCYLRILWIHIFVTIVLFYF